MNRKSKEQACYLADDYNGLERSILDYVLRQVQGACESLCERVRGW